VDWEAFRDWLAKDFSDVRNAPETIRPHIVKALSNLLKFLGMYDVFKELMRKYGISWRGKSTDDIVIERLTSVRNTEEIWIIDVNTML